MDNPTSQNPEEPFQYLKAIRSELDQPALGIICGSGQGEMANSVLPQLRLETPWYSCADIETVAIGSISSPQSLE